MGEFYFTAALQRRPEQNTVPKMERKVCSTFPFWPHAFHISYTYGNRQLSVQTYDHLHTLYQGLFWKFGSIFFYNLNAFWTFYSMKTNVAPDSMLQVLQVLSFHWGVTSHGICTGTIILNISVTANRTKGFTYPSLVLFISNKDVFLFSFISKPFKLYWNITSTL